MNYTHSHNRMTGRPRCMNHPLWKVQLFLTRGRLANKDTGHYVDCENCAKNLLVEMVEVMQQSSDPKAFISHVTGAP